MRLLLLTSRTFVFLWTKDGHQYLLFPGRFPDECRIAVTSREMLLSSRPVAALSAVETNAVAGATPAGIDHTYESFATVSAQASTASRHTGRTWPIRH